MAVPPPPPGFKLDAPQGGVPPPPPGFTLDGGGGTPPPAAPMRPDSERPVMRSRKPGVGESPNIGEAISARFHEGDQAVAASNKQRDAHPFTGNFDVGNTLRGAGGAIEEVASPLTGMMDALMKSAYGGRNSLTEPSTVRQFGDLGESLLPLPKVGAVAKGAGELAGAARTALRETGVERTLARGAKSAVKTEAATAAANEARLHGGYVDTLKKGGVDKLMPGQIKGGPARAKEAAEVESGLARTVYAKEAKEANDSFQRGTYNQALRELDEKGFNIRYPKSGPVGNEGVKNVQKTISTAYNRVVPKIVLKVDDKLDKAMQGLSEEAETLRSPETATIYRSLDRTVRQQLAKGSVLDGKTFKTMESELTRDIGALRRNPLHWREKDVLERYLREIRSAAERSSPAEIVPRLKAVNRAYANLAKIEDAAASRSEAAGHFTPKELLDTVKSEDGSQRNRQFAAGEAHMQRWAHAAHQVMRRDTEGETAIGLHIPNHPSGIAGSIARGAARPVAEHLATRKFSREAERAAIPAKAPRTPLSRSNRRRLGSGAQGAAAEAAIQSDQNR